MGPGWSAGEGISVGRFARLGLAAVMVAVVACVQPAEAAPSNPGNSKNCGDFPNWNAAQVWFESYYPHYGDVARLDADNDRIPCEGNHGAPQPSPPAGREGYLMLSRSGTVYGFGDLRPVEPIIEGAVAAIAVGPNSGYWVATGDGRVHARGLGHFGNAGVTVGDRTTTMAATRSGDGYWLFSARGMAWAFGAAAHHGDMRGVPLSAPVVGSATTTTGGGYWMLGADGGVFSFGAARFHGSTGDIRLNQPVVGMAPDPDGDGYWLVAADGGIFAFDAPFRGSVPQVLGANGRLRSPVIGAVAYGDGYLLVAADGGIFNFSNKPFHGSLGDYPPPSSVIGVGVVIGR